MSRDFRDNKDATRVNDKIRASQVRLIDADGQNVGIVDIGTALDMADEAGLDLVEVGPGETPTCKIMDYGKYKYECQKRAAEARKKQKVVQVKEIKIRHVTEENDYQVKLKKIKKFLEDGDKVKISMRFRGREITHSEIGFRQFDRIKEDTKDIAKIEKDAKLDGRQIIMVLGPAQ